jgi:hypothetical protein
VAIVEILSTGVTGRIIPEAASSRVPEVLPTYSAMLARLSPKEVEILNSLYHMATSQVRPGDHERQGAKTDGGFVEGGRDHGT